MNIKTKYLVMAAFLSAISIILTRFFYIMPTPQLRFSIGYMPIMLSGLLFGPIIGALTGIVADLVGVLINPQGTFHLGFTISSMLVGLIPALIIIFFKDSNNKKLKKPIILSCIFVCILVCILLNTYWLSLLFGKSIFVMLPIRTLKSIIEMLIIFILLTILYPIIKNIAK